MFLYCIVTMALLSGAAIEAQAETTDLGALTIGATSTQREGYVMGPFSDSFTFSLPSSGRIATSVEDHPEMIWIGSFPNIWQSAFTGISLFSNADGVFGNADDHLVTSGAITAKGDHASLATGSIVSGNYYLLVQGDTPHALYGHYGVELSALPPVPEPETYAMMLAGLGLMGSLARRRNRAKS